MNHTFGYRRLIAELSIRGAATRVAIVLTILNTGNELCDMFYEWGTADD